MKIKQTLKRAKKLVVVGVLTLVMMLVTLIVLAVLPYSSSTYLDDENAKFQIFISSNGVHTDIVLPVQSEVFDWRPYLPVDLQNFPWLAIGWGEEEFYINTPRWADVTLKKIIHSLFFSKQSLLHFTLKSDDLMYHPEKIKIKISKERLEELTDQILVWLDEKPGENTIPGFGRFDFFYRAKGSYSLFYTCNTWTAERLREISIPTPLWSGTSQAIMFHLKN